MKSHIFFTIVTIGLSLSFGMYLPTSKLIYIFFSLLLGLR